MIETAVRIALMFLATVATATVGLLILAFGTKYIVERWPGSERALLMLAIFVLLPVLGMIAAGQTWILGPETLWKAIVTGLAMIGVIYLAREFRGHDS